MPNKGLPRAAMAPNSVCRASGVVVRLHGSQQQHATASMTAILNKGGVGRVVRSVSTNALDLCGGSSWGWYGRGVGCDEGGV